MRLNPSIYRKSGGIVIRESLFKKYFFVGVDLTSEIPEYRMIWLDIQTESFKIPKDYTLNRRNMFNFQGFPCIISKCCKRFAFMISRCNMRLTYHVSIITIYRFCSQYLTQTFFFFFLFLYIWSRLLFTILPLKTFAYNVS